MAIGRYPLLVLRTGLLSVALCTCLVGLVLSASRAIVQPVAMSLHGDSLRLRGVTQRLATMPVGAALSFETSHSVITVRTRSGKFVLRGLEPDDVALAASKLRASGVTEDPAAAEGRAW